MGILDAANSWNGSPEEDRMLQLQAQRMNPSPNAPPPPPRSMVPDPGYGPGIMSPPPDNSPPVGPGTPMPQLGTADRLKLALMAPEEGAPGGREAAANRTDSHVNQGGEWAKPAGAPGAASTQSPAAPGDEIVPGMPKPAPQGTMRVEATNTPLVDPERQKEYGAAFDRYGRSLNDEDLAAKTATVASQNATNTQALADVDKAIETNKHRGETAKDAALEEKSAHDFIEKQAQLSDRLAMAKVDPQRRWKSLSTPAKIGEAMSSVIGGFLMGFQNRASNPFQDHIDKLVQEDIDAQHSDVENIRGQMSNTQTMAAESDKMFKNKADRNAATWNLALDQVDSMAKAKMATATNLKEIAALQSIMAGTEKKRADLDLQRTDAAVKMNAYTPAHTVATGPRALTFKENMELDSHQLARQEFALKQKEQQFKETQGRPMTDLEKEAAKTGLQATAAVNALSSHSPEEVSKGTRLGEMVSGLNASSGGVFNEAKKNTLTREDYNNSVNMAVAATYRLITGSPEPKNMEMIDHLAEQYRAKPTDDAATIAIRREALIKKIQAGASASGATINAGAGAAPLPPPRPGAGRPGS